MWVSLGEARGPFWTCELFGLKVDSTPEKTVCTASQHAYLAVMSTYIALLRAVNVGGTGKLPMAELRAMAEECGFSNVRTYIQTGNLMFDSDAPVEDVRTALGTRLETYAGKPVGIIWRTPIEMAEVLENVPFPDAAPNQVAVIFLNDAPSDDTQATAKGHKDEEIVLGTREVYVHFPSGMGRSKLRLSAMDHGTMRNLNSVRKLCEMTETSL